MRCRSSRRWNGATPASLSAGLTGSSTPSPELPERVISADPVAWYRPDAHLMGEENYAELVEAINDSETVRAMLEDYRAGLSVDREADRADRLAGRTIGCPTLVLWSRRGDVEVLFGDPLAHVEGMDGGPSRLAASSPVLRSPRRIRTPWWRRSQSFWGTHLKRRPVTSVRRNSGKIVRVWAWTQHAESIIKVVIARV